MIRADPNRTLIPDLIVDAIVVEPYGALPPTCRATTPRQSFYQDWGERSKEVDRPRSGSTSGVQPAGSQAYLKKLGEETLARLKPGPALSEPVNYGIYT